MEELIPSACPTSSLGLFSVLTLHWFASGYVENRGHPNNSMLDFQVKLSCDSVGNIRDKCAIHPSTFLLGMMTTPLWIYLWWCSFSWLELKKGVNYEEVFTLG